MSSPVPFPDFNPPETAPRDSRLLALLVRGGANPTEDDDVWTTIGFHDGDNVGEEDGRWHMAGWCWCCDEFTSGGGEVIGWLPFPGAPTGSGTA